MPRDPARLPFSLRVVLDNLARQGDPGGLAGALADWGPDSAPLVVPLSVDRIVLPDSSGLPVLMDFAALRDSLAMAGADPLRAEPLIRCDLVIDHSLIVDEFGHAGAARANLLREYERNAERYAFFRWAQQAFSRVKVIPPGSGIIHQVHLEHLAEIVAGTGEDAHPEFVLGCDSHTPMVNALGVLGWGVGGIDAEAAMVGEPYAVEIRRVVGVRLTGTLRPGATTTDLALTLTERLRGLGVVGDFVEFTGDALDRLAVPQRATIANMAPEYGATCSFFPIDRQTLRYLEETGRAPDHIAHVEATARRLGLFREEGQTEPVFSDLLHVDLAEIVPSVAGPSRPHQRVALPEVKTAFRDIVTRPRAEAGLGAAPNPDHGLLAIAAITACTNTSNPELMIGAGLLARNAARAGLRVPAHVKTSLAPGSRVVSRYLAELGLDRDLEALGFFTVGFGCTTCSGKSGPIDAGLARRAAEEGLVLAAALSGNRNFEGRIHKSVTASYLASPMLVVAFALAGRIDVDLVNEPLGMSGDGPVMLADIWPEPGELAALTARAARPDAYKDNYADIHAGGPEWQALAGGSGPRFAWDEGSTYIRRPPFFDPAFLQSRGRLPDRLAGARVLMRFGDALTTDHVLPSGEIGRETEAGKYLLALGVEPRAFNAYTQRRGNHEVMARATFANPRIRNLLAPETEGGVTPLFPEGGIVSVHAAAAAYRAENTPFIVLAGENYGMGSSRDWAAKGPALLGLSIVLAQSFERIHRANLIGVGILPLVFAPGEGCAALGLDGAERYDFDGLDAGIAEGATIAVCATRADGTTPRFAVRADLRSPAERALMRAGGIFPRLLSRLGGADAKTINEETEGRADAI